MAQKYLVGEIWKATQAGKFQIFGSTAFFSFQLHFSIVYYVFWKTVLVKEKPGERNTRNEVLHFPNFNWSEKWPKNA